MTEGFFDSEVVINSIEEISRLQEEVLIFSQFAEFASLSDQKQNLEQLKILHEKQKNMCFRCMISDHEEARAMLHDVLDHFKSYGHKIDLENPLKVFDEVELQLKEMEDDIEYCEKFGFFPGEEPGGEQPPYIM